MPDRCDAGLVLGQRALMQATGTAVLAAALAPHYAHAATMLRAACVGTSFQSLNPSKASSAPDF